jgi:hypothetical protein
MQNSQTDRRAREALSPCPEGSRTRNTSRPDDPIHRFDTTRTTNPAHPHALKGFEQALHRYSPTSCTFLFLHKQRRLPRTMRPVSLPFDLSPFRFGLCTSVTLSVSPRILSFQPVYKQKKREKISRVRNLLPLTNLLPGSDLLSHKVALAVPSALESLTAVFGMGTGGASPPRPPGKLFFLRFGTLQI